MSAGLSPVEKTRFMSERAIGGGAGSATITRVNPKTLQISTDLNGMPPTTTDIVQLRAGLCADPNESSVVANLQPVDADGTGAASGSVDYSPAYGLPEVGWSLVVMKYQQITNPHLSAPVMLACGDVVFHEYMVMRFDPEDLDVHVGDTVEWVNPTPWEIHTVTFVPKGDSHAGRSQPEGRPTLRRSRLRRRFRQLGNHRSRRFVEPDLHETGQVQVQLSDPRRHPYGRGDRRPA